MSVQFKHYSSSGKPEEEKSVDLAMASGNQVVNPTSGKVMSKVTIVKPVTMLPENIKKDVNIGGVVGTFAGGAELNIAYGDTPPTDTSKLWVKAAAPANIKIDAEIVGSEVMNSGIATLPTAARGIAAAAVGTKVYLFGGNSLNTINVFDTTTSTISTLSATLPTATEGTAAATVGTKVYLFGGHGSSYLNTIQCFDTTTNTISTLSATLPTAARGIAAATVGTKVYLFGGEYNGFLTNNTIQCFDTATNTINTLSATLPTAARGIAAAAVGTKVYLFGGNSLNTINVFDTTTSTISTLSATLPTATEGTAAATVGTKVYLFGGHGSSYLNTIQCFDTTTNTISTLSATLPIAAYAIAAAAVGTKIYLFGGYKENGYLGTINLFIVQQPLANGNILIQADIVVNLFAIISSDSLQMNIGIKQVYKGNASNFADLCDAYLHNGTNWVNVNTGETYSV